MKTEFETISRNGNKSGSGFFYLPENKYYYFKLHDRVNVKINNKLEFFGKIVNSNKKFGVYIPKKLFTKNNLLGKKINVSISKLNGFYSKIDKDGRFYIPNSLAKELKIRDLDIICITGLDVNENKIIEKYSRINVRKKPDTEEYMCTFDKNYYGMNLIFSIKKMEKCNSNSCVEGIIKHLKYSHLDKNNIVLFSRQKNPIIINTKFDLYDIALYLGAYFSDGTKKGNSWAICASTPEQANFYSEMHSFLVKNSKPELTISYTTKTDNIDNVKKTMRSMWLKEGFDVNKFRIRKPVGNCYGKTNENGTLIIREHKQALLDFYNALLKALFDEIIIRKNKPLAIDFLCGVLEGDGSVSSKKRGHVIITTNENELKILESLMNITGLKYKTNRRDRRFYIRIGALEILRNFDNLKNKIFVYYPKRRKVLFERLQTVGAVKFLIGNHHKPSSWVKSWLKENGLVDNNYVLTKKGTKLGNDIKKYIRTTTTK